MEVYLVSIMFRVLSDSVAIQAKTPKCLGKFQLKMIGTPKGPGGLDYDKMFKANNTRELLPPPPPHAHTQTHTHTHTHNGKSLF